MKKLLTLLITAILTLNISALFAAGADDADIVVDINGTGDYTTLQAAIDAVESNSDRRTVIFIKRGTYDTEKLIIPEEKQNVTLVGESRDETIISYHIYDCSGGLNDKCPAEDVALWSGDNISTSATLTILGDGFRAENLTIQNTAGAVGQALAIAVKSDKNMFINCNFFGYQDTIYFWASGVRSYFDGCLVLGRTDYIYGGGIAYFQECEIRSYGGGYITAPSAPKDQKYGYVFNECELTYTDGSPHSGDDGSTIALGRPWHNYPKVTWMNSNFCAEINPLGWPTTWNMDYAATSDSLELYEYNNTGAGADMSGRSDWVGLRALEDGEDTLYTIQKVLNGSDGWDPTEEEALSATYTWTDSAAANSSWLDSANWSSKTLPGNGETAVVDSAYTIVASGGTFTADLILNPYSEIENTDDDTVSFLSMAGTTLYCDTEAVLVGKIKTKDTVSMEVTGELTIEAVIIGVNDISFNESGTVHLQGISSSFDGDWFINKGTVTADVTEALGTGDVTVKSGAKLTINNEDAFYVKSILSAVTGASIELNADIVLSQFYIDGTIQDVGTYNSTTNPDLISGTGSITIGRPDSFEFLGGTWDDADNFSPALMPEAGETVNNSTEMETASTTFVADIIITSTGNIRLRGTHTCTGLITMEEGSKLTYATSGTGFTLKAPIAIEGDVYFNMSSSNTSGNSMILPGNITGSSDIDVYAHNANDSEYRATVVLKGDNSGFSGNWDLTTENRNENGQTAFSGNSENAYGNGIITIAENNVAILNHARCAGDTLKVNFTGEGKILVTKDTYVYEFMLDSTYLSDGVYTSTEFPDKISGTKSIFVGEEYIGFNDLSMQETMVVYNSNEQIIEVLDNNSELKIFTINGSLVNTYRNKNTIDVSGLQQGIYLIQYNVDNTSGVLKMVR